ncbi:beta-class carbonic anhydrase [Thalassobacillus devorans]|uniref:beta-class carbonic anhydrase n=1 Tax=Thalassobacillus devorans TaxID=279813 RepID=UPI00048AAC79|nr:carbonic anhydrase [Thalassobacillus devorans]
MYLDEILDYNRTFVEEKQYLDYQTDKFPDKKLAILSCMDTRLVELLPRALNIKNGDVKMVKNAGAIVTHPFDSVVRSLFVAAYELKADEIMVIGHHGCGMKNFDGESTISKMKDQGISDETLKTLDYAGVNVNNWLQGFESVEESVKNSVEILRNHPLLPQNTPVHGLVIDPETGKLDLVTKGYQE